MKKSHRILRDVSLVIVFCAGFLGLVGLANFLQNDADEQTSSEFSEYRLGADKAAVGHNLDVSLQNLRALVKNDPYDGRAQFELASTLLLRVVETQDAITESDRKALPDSSDPQESESRKQTSSPADTQANRDRVAELKSLIDEAIQEYKLAERHPRYRSRSRIQLAILQSSKGDYDAALDSLEDFVNDGGATRNGLGNIEQFGSSFLDSKPTKLHAYPRFSLIVVLERQNRGRPVRWFKSLNQRDTGVWNFVQRLNADLVVYRARTERFIVRRNPQWKSFKVFGR